VTAPTRPVRLSSVVLSWNSSRHIEGCVRSLLAESDASGGDDEIIVVENGSTDGAVEILKRLEQERPQQVKVLYLERNTGTTVSRNLALQRAAGRYVAVIDSDVIVPPGTLAPLLARLEQDPSCGLVAPLLRYPDGRLQMSTDVFPTLPRKIRRLLSLKRMERRRNSRDWPRVPIDVDYAISAFWVMRRSTVDRVGFLDERIFYSPEDVDYCLRMWEAGYRVVYDPTVQAIHCAQEISRGFPVSAAAFSHVGGLLYLFRKHRYAFSRARLYRRFSEVRTDSRAVSLSPVTGHKRVL